MTKLQKLGLFRKLIFFALALLCTLITLGDDIPEATTPKPLKTKLNSKDGATLVWVPAGKFLMGSSNDDLTELLSMSKHKNLKLDYFADEQPQHEVTLDGYWIYQNLVTVAQFRRFCRETKRVMPAIMPWSADNHPMVNVTWQDAADYAKWAGVRLPTEAEWEKAARGDDGRRYPWGKKWDPKKCLNYEAFKIEDEGNKNTKESHKTHKEYKDGHTAPAGSYPAGASPYGALDMAGNVWEWCADWYSAEYYAISPKTNPTGPETGEFRVLRGGCWGSSDVTCRSANRHADSPDATYRDEGGFRCAMGEK